MLRIPLIILVISVAVTGCKPEKPEMTRFRVSMLQALGGENKAGLDPEVEEETVATLGGDRLTLGELAAALRLLPPYARYYYSSATRMERFLKNYVLLNLCASEAVKKGFDKAPYVRQIYLAELERQFKNDLLSDRVRAEAGVPVETMADRRRQAWGRHLEELRREASVQVNDDRLNEAAKRLEEVPERSKLPLTGLHED